MYLESESFLLTKFVFFKYYVFEKLKFVFFKQSLFCFVFKNKVYFLLSSTFKSMSHNMNLILVDSIVEELILIKGVQRKLKFS